MILNVDKLRKNFGYGSLFEDLSFTLNEGEILSIVGINGCGKSTLLKMIAGLEKIDGGTVNIKKGAKVFYLDQISSSIMYNRKVLDVLKDAFVELVDMEERPDFLQKVLSQELTQDEYDTNLKRYCNMVEKFAMAGGYDIDFKINTVVEGLKIDKNLLSQNYNNLSGGEKTLIQLAKALLFKPDLFLLDEPTNHLDIERIEWLENYLKSFQGAIIIVSHDRYFINKFAQKTIEFASCKTTTYLGNYDYYKSAKK